MATTTDPARDKNVAKNSAGQVARPKKPQATRRVRHPNATAVGPIRTAWPKGPARRTTPLGPHTPINADPGPAHAAGPAGSLFQPGLRHTRVETVLTHEW
ncbi:hypothetical protein GCM10010273_55010 [Streptomyces lavendulocolor]